MTRFVWLRQFEPGSNSADANRLLDRLEHLRRLAVPEGLFGDIPPHRITRLRRQGERYFADGLRELPDNRRLAILAVCAVEWETFLADAVVETHDRIVGRTYREAARTCESQLGDETAAVREALRAFAELGGALIGARDTGEALDAVIADGPGWGVSETLSPRLPRSRTRLHRTRWITSWGATAASGATRRECCARWTSRRRPWPSPCWRPSTSCAATARRGQSSSRPRVSDDSESPFPQDQAIHKQPRGRMRVPHVPGPADTGTMSQSYQRLERSDLPERPGTYY